MPVQTHLTSTTSLTVSINIEIESKYFNQGSWTIKKKKNVTKFTAFVMTIEVCVTTVHKFKIKNLWKNSEWKLTVHSRRGTTTKKTSQRTCKNYKSKTVRQWQKIDADHCLGKNYFKRKTSKLLPQAKLQPDLCKSSITRGGGGVFCVRSAPAQGER